jgi:hypothetical protein
MTTRSWIRRLFAPSPRTRRKAPARFRPRLEALEDRLAPAVLTDTTPANNSVSATEGNAFSNLVLTTFDDADPNATTADFTVTSVSYTGNPTFTSGPIYVVQSAGPASGGLSHWQVVVSGTVAEQGNYIATVAISDAAGSTFLDSNTTLAVDDAALTDTTPANNTVPATEGQAFNNVVIATFDDANPNATAADFPISTISVSYTNNPTFSTAPTYSVQSAGPATGGMSHWQVLASGTIAEEGSYTATVNVSDVDGSTSQSISTFSVADAALSPGTLTPPTAIEGQPVTGAVLFHFSDANPDATAADFTATVTWGDGTVEDNATSANVSVVANPGGGFDVVGSHTYGEDASGLTFTVTVQDQGGGPAISASNTSFSVADAALTAGTLTPPVATEGTALSNVVLFHFSDADPNATASNFKATVTWGDSTVEDSVNNPTTVSVVPSAAGGFDVLGSHTYSEDAVGLTFTVAVQDQGGAAPISASNTNFSVADAALTPGTLTVPPNPVPGTPTSSQVLLHFSDANPGATASDYTATVTWGDGTVEDNVNNPSTISVVASGDGFDVVGAHTYLQGGVLNFRVDVADRGGMSTSGSGTVSVSTDAVVPGTAADDTLLLRRATDGPVGSVTYVLNNNDPVTLRDITSFTFDGADGNDNLTVSLGDGRPLVPGLIRFDGGTGSNTLLVDAASAGLDGMLRTRSGQINADGQAISYANVQVTNLDNGAAVNTLAGPDTRDGATAFAGLSAAERFVQALYLDELGRAGSTAELDGWVNGMLNRPGGSRGAVAAGIAGSAEARDHLVKSWYIAFLGRQANGKEEQGFVSELQAGMTEEQVLSQVLGSGEFLDRAQTLVSSGTPAQRFVQSLFQLLLDRPADANELSSQTAGLDVSSASARQAGALGVLQSPEFRTDQFEGYYNALLHRPSDAGLNGWASSGLDLHSVRLHFETSDEFFVNG